MVHARVFLCVCFAFVGGVALSSVILVPVIFLWWGFVFALIPISVFWKKDKRIVTAGFCLLLFATGVFRHQMFERPVDNQAYHKQITAVHSDLLNLRLIREKLGESIDRFLSPPQGALLSGIMLGDTSQFSRELKDKLNISGTRHITAISGMNIMMLAEMLIGVGLFFGLWRGQAFYFAIVMIVLFIIMVGAPASAIRAGIMGGIVLFAEKVGRLAQAQRLLVFAAAIMLAFNPLLLRFDIGFQLSFLATLGIAKLSGWFREKFAKIPETLGLKSALAMTFPAVIFTAPILAANFGQISLISVASNILILPVIPMILGLGFLASLVGIIFEPLGTIAFSPVWLLLSYIYKVAEISAALPFAVMKVEFFPWYLAGLYFALLWWGIKRFKIEDNKN